MPLVIYWWCSCRHAGVPDIFHSYKRFQQNSLTIIINFNVHILLKWLAITNLWNISTEYFYQIFHKMYVLKKYWKWLTFYTCSKISACSENCNACCVFKISAHVENCNACSKICWIFQGVLKTCWKFQGMLKTIICVENYVETACWKFQHVWKTVMHVESYVKISRCVENVYVRHVENYIGNHVEVWKKHHHTLTAHVEIEWQISFFSFGFARVTEVRHICNGLMRIRNGFFTTLKSDSHYWNSHPENCRWEEFSPQFWYVADVPLVTILWTCI